MCEWTNYRATKGKVRHRGGFYDFDASRHLDTRFHRVTVCIEEKGERMGLLTSRLELSAETLAMLLPKPLLFRSPHRPIFDSNGFLMKDGG